jgi:NADPH-ferrihemoprotein reductase
MEFLNEPSFSSGATTLDNLHYIIFALGNRTYEHFCAVGRQLDAKLTALGAKRLGALGEGDADKSTEEDYLAWKAGMFQALRQHLALEEGRAVDQPDFEIDELPNADISSVYLGELSRGALLPSSELSGPKNPHLAPLLSSRELYAAGERNCVFAEFGIKNSGMHYEAGDHLGIWPMNPNEEVERLISVLGFDQRRHGVIDMVPLDPALARVPFPTPTTMDAILRHYLDINATVSRQTCAALARWAPEESEARRRLVRWGCDKGAFHTEVAQHHLKLSELIMYANNEGVPSQRAPWSIPFDRLVSLVPRLQPRYYSISSSPKLFPDSIHVTAVVLKYSRESLGRTAHTTSETFVYGTTTNYLLGLTSKVEMEAPQQLRSTKDTAEARLPTYNMAGPRDKYLGGDGLFRVPIHVRKSTFRLPTSPTVPVIMVGPGTGVAPFRGFIQDRVALARAVKKTEGPKALKAWGDILLYFGCRAPDIDYLYSDEWQEYAKELDGKFKVYTAFSRVPGKDKVYVQQLLSGHREMVRKAIVDDGGYVYICGDAKGMAKSVEDVLRNIVGDGQDGEAELQLLKKKKRLQLDVW